MFDERGYKIMNDNITEKELSDLINIWCTLSKVSENYTELYSRILTGDTENQEIIQNSVKSSYDALTSKPVVDNQSIMTFLYIAQNMNISEELKEVSKEILDGLQNFVIACKEYPGFKGYESTILTSSELNKIKKPLAVVINSINTVAEFVARYILVILESDRFTRLIRQEDIKAYKLKLLKHKDYLMLIMKGNYLLDLGKDIADTPFKAVGKEEVKEKDITIDEQLFIPKFTKNDLTEEDLETLKYVYDYVKVITKELMNISVQLANPITVTGANVIAIIMPLYALLYKDGYKGYRGINTYVQRGYKEALESKDAVHIDFYLKLSTIFGSVGRAFQPIVNAYKKTNPTGIALEPADCPGFVPTIIDVVDILKSSDIMFKTLLK